jgi:dimethylhistidine N-methyltransferase
MAIPISSRRPRAALAPAGGRRVSRPRVLRQIAADAVEERSQLLAGLLERPARIDPKYFYDAQGSALYGAITRLEEYYPTRTEAAILKEHREAICQALPAQAQWIDLGCGDGEKALDWLQATRAQRYIGVDTAEPWLRTTLRGLAKTSAIEAIGVVADLSRAWSLQHLLAERPQAPALFFYPGSSIGNFSPAASRALLQNIRRHCDDGGALLIGVDFVKDRRVLEAAYDDALGVTAAFNRNVLRVVNGLLDADFEPAAFAHLALFNEAESRIEMHLLSRCAQTVRIGAPARATRNFELGETIITEYSHKYTAQCFSQRLTMAGFTRQTLWTDGADPPWYGVFLATP